MPAYYPAKATTHTNALICLRDWVSRDSGDSPAASTQHSDGPQPEIGLILRINMRNSKQLEAYQVHRKTRRRTAEPSNST